MGDGPLNAWVIGMHSFLLAFAGRHAESVREAARAFDADTESFFAQWNAMRAHAWAGDQGRAIDLAPALLAGSGRHPWVLGLLAWSHARAGHAAIARAVADELMARARVEFMSPFWLAVAADAAGMDDEAMRCLEMAVVERDPMTVLSRRMPMLEGVKADARYASLMKDVPG